MIRKRTKDMLTADIIALFASSHCPGFGRNGNIFCLGLGRQILVGQCLDKCKSKEREFENRQVSVQTGTLL